MMARKTFFALAILCGAVLIAFPLSLRADDSSTESKSPQFYVEPFVGSNVMPGFLLGFEADRHPDELKGHIEGVRTGYLFNDRYSLGIALLHADVSGTGLWGDKSQEASHGVSGTTYGTAQIEIFGVAIEGVRRFYLIDNLNLVTRAGLGVGYLDVRFNGVFDGYLLQDPSITINEPANETHNRIIPVVELGAGIEWRPIKNFSIVVGPYWNTGYGAEGSLNILF